VLRAPAGRLLAPMLPVLVPLLRRDKELVVTDGRAALLMRMSAATIDRKLAGERAKLFPRGRSHTKPGTLLKSQIPVRTWAEWDDAVPGFVEIDLVGHEGGNSFGEFCFTLTVTDVSTGWTVNRSVRNKAAKWVFEALEYVTTVFPFPIIGIDSDNGSEFINEHLLAYCHAHQITFTRSRPGNKNDGAHVEQKNWARVRELVRYLRYDTAAELEKLNEIWELDRIFTNYLLPQQKLIEKQRHGAKVTKKARRTCHTPPPGDPARDDAQTPNHPDERRLQTNQTRRSLTPDPGTHRSAGNTLPGKTTRRRQTHQQGLEQLKIRRFFNEATNPSTGGFQMRQRITFPGGIAMRQQGKTIHQETASW
jgi:hypothetical protein